MIDIRAVLGSGRIAVLSPHSDDAALSVGATLMLAASQDCVVHLLTLFSRSRRTRIGGVELSEERVTAMRKLEDASFIEMLGTAVGHWCDLPDPSVRMPDSREEWYVPRQLSAEEMGYIDGIVRFCQERIDSGCTLLAPAGCGSNRDHLMTREAALQLVRRGGPALLLYEDLPYAAAIGAGQVESEITRTLRSAGWRAGARRVSFPSLLLKKRKAIASYASQLNSDISFRVLRYAVQVGGFPSPAERLWLVAGDDPALHRASASS